MRDRTRHVVVIGQGAAGLCASISAAASARSRGLAMTLTLIDAASAADSGGNTRWSPSNIRLQANHQTAPGFVDDIMAESGGLAERDYFETLARQASAMADWLVSLGVQFQSPPYYLAKGPSRIQPAGGGAALIAALLAQARALGVDCVYQQKLTTLSTQDGRISGVRTEAADGRLHEHRADAVILACGGFEGNAAMRKTHLGPAAEHFRLISPGTAYNDGAGIRAALAIGAQRAGDWQGAHAEPIDPRSRQSAPVVLVYPFGVVVDASGQRFFDEGEALMHETWERFANHMQHAVAQQQAYLILDAKLFSIADYQRAIRSEVAPISAPSLEDLARALQLNPQSLQETVKVFNAACPDDTSRFDPTRTDGLRCTPPGQPVKSNWARALDSAPYLAWPLVGSLVYTFGGLKTNPNAQVLGTDGPIAGLYAAGEITGHFYRQAPNSVAMLRALVYGKIAGEQVVADLLQTEHA